MKDLEQKKPKMYFSGSDEGWNDDPDWNVSIAGDVLTGLINKIAAELVKLEKKDDIQALMKKRPKFGSPQWTFHDDGLVIATIMYDEKTHGEDDKGWDEIQLNTKYHVKLDFKIVEKGESKEDPYYERNETNREVNTVNENGD